MLAGGLADRTRTERARVVAQAARATGQHPVAFTPDALMHWLAGIGTNSTRLTYFRALQAWHRWLMETGRRSTDPMVKLPKPREPKRVPHPVATGALERVLASGIRRRTQAMILLACYAGLRVHEIAVVRGEDVDLDGHRLRVHGKGGTVRWLPLCPVLEEVASWFGPTGWWFPSTRHPGRPMRRDTASSTISRALTRAGVAGSAHSIRHWFGTEALAAGGNLRVVQELLRHGSVATTQMYTQVSADQMMATVLRLPDVTGRGPR